MLTREQIEEIQSEKKDRGISLKELLKEKGISASQYFWWCRRYVRDDEPSGFIPVSGVAVPTGRGSVQAQPAPQPGGQHPAPATESWMSIELRTVSGADMRIQGGLTPAMVQAILKSV